MATRALRQDAGREKPTGQAAQHNHVFRDFAGMNTQAKRQAIGPQEFAWLENVMPVGHGNLITTPAVSDILATGWDGVAYNMRALNLNGANYMFVVTTTGHAYQISLDTFAVVEITNPLAPEFPGTGVTFDQWNDERILFITTNGYFSWDGSLLLQNGILTGITITDGGAYTTIPTISFIGGGGAGATADAVMGINGGQEIVAAGTGYTPGDILTMVGGTFTNPGKLKVITAPGGMIDAVAVFDPGSYTVLPGAPVGVTGGTGADDFTFNPVYAVFSVIITGGGTIPYNEPPQVVFSASGLTGLEGDQAIAAAGTGYVPGEILTMVGGTFTTAATLTVTVTVGGGVNKVSIANRGVYTVQPANPVASTGGGADDATFTLNWASDLAAAGTAVLIEGPETGQAIATFSNRVWIAQGRTLLYSAPGDWANFSTNGAGSTDINDSTLHSIISFLASANNFLYVGGVDSVNVIGDVSVNSLGDTIFSNTNLTASIGTNRGTTAIPYYRSLLFLNPSGIYSIYGSTPLKISDPLDGVFANFIDAAVSSAGTVMLNNILCAAFTIGYTDQATQTARSVQAIFFNRKWFVTHQPIDVVFMAGGINNGLQRLYATDGVALYQLFEDASTPVEWLIESAYWDMKDVTLDKQALAFGFEIDTLSAGTVTVNIDAIQKTPPFIYTDDYQVTPADAVVWVNDSGNAVAWVNDSAEVVEWLNSGYFLVMQDGDDDQESLSAQAKYLGMRLSSSDVIGTISSMMLKYSYRASW